jgi:hypothetical protein
MPPRTRITLNFLGRPGVGPLLIVALSLAAGVIGVWGYDWRWGMLAIMVAGLVFVATTDF